MDNPPASQQLEIPNIPADFNGGVGVDFAQKLVQFLRGATVTTVGSGGVTPGDLAEVQAEVESLSDRFDNNVRRQEKVVINGVNNGETIVTFTDLGTSDYEVVWEIIIPSGNNPPTITVAVVDGSKTSTQFRARIDGTGSAYKFQFTVTAIKTTAT